MIPHLHLESDKPEGVRSKLQKTTMMIFAVTLHNIPEGMAVGVVYAGAAMGNMGVSITGAFALSIGIAIQNFPEGAIVSMPLVGEGMSKKKAFLYGTLSGAVELWSRSEVSSRHCWLSRSHHFFRISLHLRREPCSMWS